MIPSRAASLILAFCTVLAGLSAAQPTAAQADDPAQARLELQVCRNGRGDANACNNYGLHLLNGAGVAQDKRAGLRYFRMACEMDYMRACENVAVETARPDGDLRNVAESIRYLRRACDGGWSSACHRLGYRLRDGVDGATQDHAAGLRAFELACNMRNGEACFEAGFFYLNGWGVAADDAAAARVYQSSCSLNFARGCSQLAFLAYSGRGIAQDAAMAVLNYRRACSGGSEVACSVLDQIRNSGPGGFAHAELTAAEADGFPSNATADQRYILASAALANEETARAVAAFETLAQEGMADAAYSLGQIYYDGQGVAMDRPRAARYFERAANGGHPYAQFVTAQFMYHGTLLGRNEIWAIQLMRAAHETGGLAEAGPIWQAWQSGMNARYDARDAANRQMAIENERSQAAADAANMARIWGLYSGSQNRQENGQVCGTIYRNNQAHYECMARETFDNYYNPNR